MCYNSEIYGRNNLVEKKREKNYLVESEDVKKSPYPVQDWLQVMQQMFTKNLSSLWYKNVVRVRYMKLFELHGFTTGTLRMKTALFHIGYRTWKKCRWTGELHTAVDVYNKGWYLYASQDYVHFESFYFPPFQHWKQVEWGSSPRRH